MIAELLEFGYSDDARYARVFTQDKRALEAWGNERIARALRERGVERELIERCRSSEAAGPDVDGGQSRATEFASERRAAAKRRFARWRLRPAVPRRRIA